MHNFDEHLNMNHGLEPDNIENELHLQQKQHAKIPMREVLNNKQKLTNNKSPDINQICPEIYTNRGANCFSYFVN